MLSIDEAIKHCLEVAEENDLAAETYEILAENNHNAYERLTAETNSSRCAECAADHRQLAEWLTDYKKSQEELAEAKRLLKLAICELGDAQDCDSCIADCSIGTDCIYKWHCSNEAEKLING